MRRAFVLICIAAALLAPFARAQDATEPTAVVLDQEGQRAISGINAFTIDLYKRKAKRGENLFLSPASVSVAVGLAYRGAVGISGQQLDQTLHFGAPPAAYLRANGQLLSALNFSGPGRQLQSANAVWVQSGMPLIPDFEADIGRYAKAGLQRTDFATDPEASRNAINQWVEGATHDKITDLLHPGDIKQTTTAVLVNALYWKGAWATPFDVEATKPELFTMAGGSKAQTPLMHLDLQEFKVLQRGGIKAISLPYIGGEVSMIALLPKSPDGLDRLDKALTTQAFHHWISGLNQAPPQPTLLTFPKLSLDWRGDLKDDLVAMGAPVAFGDDADFSGIAKLPYPGGDPYARGLKIAHVIHQTTLDIEEKNTEAAAATAVVMDVIVTSGRRGPPPPPPFIFKADHPFLFALVDNRTGMILFMGRYAKPTPVSADASPAATARK